jgi:hypothetical protein
MSKRRWVAARLFPVVAGAGVALGICVLTVSTAISAPPPFSNSNYVNRYICNVTSEGNLFTAVMSLNPNGSGTYTAGTLVGSVTQFGVVPFNPASTPEDNSCSYSLVLPSSSYLVGSNGLTTEVLTWKAVGGNDPSCPTSPGSFIMSQETVLRANVNAAGAVQQLSISSGNLFNLGLLAADPGDGYCLK